MHVNGQLVVPAGGQLKLVETVRQIERYMDGDMKRAPAASDSLVTPWSPQTATPRRPQRKAELIQL